MTHLIFTDSQPAGRVLLGRLSSDMLHLLGILEGKDRLVRNRLSHQEARDVSGSRHPIAISSYVHDDQTRARGPTSVDTSVRSIILTFAVRIS